MNAVSILQSSGLAWHAEPGRPSDRNVVGWCQKPPPDRPLCLVISDVDSTLINEEVIDLLAERAGVGAEVSRVTSEAMDGKLDFSDSLRLRTKLLAGLPENAFDEVFRSIHIRPGAAKLVEWVHSQGAKFGVVSGGFTPIVRRLAQELGIDFWRANELEIRNGRITGNVLGEIVTAKTKQQTLLHKRNQLCSDSNGWTAALGDGANDIPMLQTADRGIGIIPKQAVLDAVENFLSIPDLEAIIPMLGGIDT